MLTVAGSAEVRLASWDEIDLDAAVWAVPGSRMKARRPHRVPLCDRAVEIVHEAEALRGNPASPGNALVFPNRRSKPLSNMTLSKLVKEQGIANVPRGFPLIVPGLGGRRDGTPSPKSSRRRWRTSCTTASR